ncbi:MAG: hypothetical protein JSS87_12200 [Acidobacteria bacterium]|nr:hypothetical protein [Acidobacteriota bacterium]
MRGLDNNERAFEERLTRALEKTPSIEIPANFAQRVLGALPERRWSPQIVRSRYGRNAGIASMVLLACTLVALLVVQPQNAFVSLGVEPLLALQLGALVFWFAIRRKTSA